MAEPAGWPRTERELIAAQEALATRAAELG
jgi:hypothetical protein